MNRRSVLAGLMAVVMSASVANAGLKFIPGSADNGVRWIAVQGDFDYSDDLKPFADMALASKPGGVVFSSPGGNVIKAMELGRLIRSLGLNTIQPRGLECASACALAFLGGVGRFAEPGSIGVHRSSFSNTEGMTVTDAVAEIQKLTAQVIAYISEMGADPALLQLALSYDSSDIRYLSGSEMTQFRVTTPAPASEVSSIPTVTAPSPTAATTTTPDLTLPKPTAGAVHHPRGKASVLMSPSEGSTKVAILTNGERVEIESQAGQWYRVRAGTNEGYMHNSWIAVDGFEGGHSELRLIQIRSFNNYSEAEAFARSSSIKADVYAAVSGWFAVTIASPLDLAAAKSTTKALKATGALPEDAFVSYGNNYVRRVCCQ